MGQQNPRSNFYAIGRNFMKKFNFFQKKCRLSAKIFYDLFSLFFQIFTLCCQKIQKATINSLLFGTISAKNTGKKFIFPWNLKKTRKTSKNLRKSQGLREESSYPKVGSKTQDLGEKTLGVETLLRIASNQGAAK